jgi:D-alanyl-D-alanine carboxypeptidase
VTGEPFYQYLRETVLTAAHLDAPAANVFNAYTDRDKLQVTGYISYAMQPPRVLPLEAPGWSFGDGELAMPASSLLTWDITYMTQSILSPASYKEMETPFVLKKGKPSNYGLGLHIGAFNGHRILEHSGEVGGYVAENVIFPDDQAAIVVLTNEVASSAAADIAKAIGSILLPSAAAVSSDTPPDPVAAQLPAILAALAKGQIDRALFSANCNSFFSPEALADYKATLAPLGAVTQVTRTSTNQRGGMTFGLYRIAFASGTALLLDTYTLPSGKIEQLLILSKD